MKAPDARVGQPQDPAIFSGLGYQVGAGRQRQEIKAKMDRSEAKLCKLVDVLDMCAGLAESTDRIKFDFDLQHAGLDGQVGGQESKIRELINVLDMCRQGTLASPQVQN